MSFAFPVNICRNVFLKCSPSRSASFFSTIDIETDGLATQRDRAQICKKCLQVLQTAVHLSAMCSFESRRAVSVWRSKGKYVWWLTLPLDTRWQYVTMTFPPQTLCLHNRGNLHFVLSFRICFWFHFFLPFNLHLFQIRQEVGITDVHAVCVCLRIALEPADQSSWISAWKLSHQRTPQRRIF